MGKVFLLALLAGALAFGALCAPALAQSDSAVDEYQENVPGAGGGPSSNEGGQGGGGAGGGGGSESGGGSAGGGAGSSLAPATADELSEQGSAGSGLSEFTERTGTAPASSQGSAGGQGSGGGSGGGSDASAGSTSTTSSDDEGFFGGLGDVLSTLLLGTDSGSDSGGLGVLFPILLIAALLGTVAFLVLRRRRGDAEQHPG